MISISDAFEGGNIALLDIIEGENGSVVVELNIKKDPYSEFEQKHHYQYFCFRATSNEKTTTNVQFKIQNAGETSYPQAWKGSTVCYSPQLEQDGAWRRKTKTSYDDNDGVLSWNHAFDESGSVYFAYFPPFSYHRHLKLIAKCSSSSSSQSPCTVTSLGQSLDGREMDLIQIGTGPTIAWIIHRQHPGECQAEFYAEGLLQRLLGFDQRPQGEVDGNVRKALQLYTFYIVPCMCPDGAVRGHLRTNAVGANLNREWATLHDNSYVAPSLERSPEVYHVLKKMEETGVDLFLDIHGDEELPVVFLAGAQGTPNFEKSPRMATLHGAFLAAYTRANADMQSTIGYTPVSPEKVVINTATKVVATKFDCLACTLEMPFKDCATNPNPQVGWSPTRARLLGASVLEPLLYIQPCLRAQGEFWKESLNHKQDAYIRPQHREFTYGENNEVLDL